jgi:hypothetical protein
MARKIPTSPSRDSPAVRAAWWRGTLDRMQLLDIGKCARPVLFQNEYAGWPFSNGGTGFIVRFHNRHYVVTAKHVLRLKNFDLGQFRVQYRPDLNQFLPLSAVLYDDPVAGEIDTDRYDVAAFRVDEPTLQPDLFGDYQPYTLRAFDRMTIFNAAAGYLYKGYPISERCSTSTMRMIEIF